MGYARFHVTSTVALLTDRWIMLCRNKELLRINGKRCNPRRGENGVEPSVFFSREVTPHQRLRNIVGRGVVKRLEPGTESQASPMTARPNRRRQDAAFDHRPPRTSLSSPGTSHESPMVEYSILTTTAHSTFAIRTLRGTCVIPLPNGFNAVTVGVVAGRSRIGSPVGGPVAIRRHPRHRPAQRPDDEVQFSQIASLLCREVFRG